MLITTYTDCMKLIDLRHGEQIFGDREAAKELHVQFIQQLPDSIKSIVSSNTNKSYKVMQEYTHSLRGACCYASTPRLLLALEELDKHSLKLSKQGKYSQEDILQATSLCTELEKIASDTIHKSSEEH